MDGNRNRPRPAIAKKNYFYRTRYVALLRRKCEYECTNKTESALRYQCVPKNDEQTAFIRKFAECYKACMEDEYFQDE